MYFLSSYPVAFLDILGYSWTFLDILGHSWTFLDILGQGQAMRKYKEQEPMPSKCKSFVSKCEHWCAE
eukprot:7576874-Pyramimonas_sp.AAC.1